MAGHAQLKFVMTECSKTQIRLTGLKLKTKAYFDRWFSFTLCALERDQANRSLLFASYVHFSCALERNQANSSLLFASNVHFSCALERDQANSSLLFASNVHFFLFKQKDVMAAISCL